MYRLMRYIEEFLAGHKKSIVMLLILIAVTGGLLGIRYYKSTREDPNFCATCHMMQESFRSWEKSEHRDVICQKCHRLTLLEQNKLLVAYVVKGYTAPQEQTHGRVAPWRTCRACHMQEAQQGSVSMRKSYGHARHVFMEGIDCIKCHSSKLHNFEPDERACITCHTDRLVHGLGMEGLSCLKCHSYGEDSPKMISEDKCRRCHTDVSTGGPMARIHCNECHKPHEVIKMTNADCMGNCHGNEARVGQHGLHLEKTDMGCIDCHRAHDWVVGKKEAPSLCNRCHALKDPMTFIF